MKRRFLVLGFGFAWIAAGCGSVSTVGGTGGSPGSGTGGQAGGAAGARGTGGAAGVPGTGGAAGTPETGGHAGGAGGGGHGGGKGGAGGHAGEGGASGGHGGGTAGSSGAGGHAGAGGKGGGGGHGGQTCDDIAAAFEAAVPIAESCTPGVEHQCEDTALTAPLTGCPGCAQYVNDNTMLNALRMQYNDQGCPHTVVCPAILCIQPQKAGCMPSDASAGGTCKPVVLTGGN